METKAQKQVQNLNKNIRIWFGGKKDTLQEMLIENLANVGRQPGHSTQVCEWRPGENMPAAEDYVWIFAGGEDPMEILFELESLVQIQPGGILLITDDRVYGTLFGSEHALKEEELGYLCHTRDEEMEAQWMRSQEHLAWRLANEEGLRVKIVRLAGRPEEPDTLAIAQLLEHLLLVQFHGENGRIYNLPAAQDARESEISPLSSLEIELKTSPLSPMVHRLDCSAFRQLESTEGDAS